MRDHHLPTVIWHEIISNQQFVGWMRKPLCLVPWLVNSGCRAKAPVPTWLLLNKHKIRWREQQGQDPENKIDYETVKTTAKDQRSCLHPTTAAVCTPSQASHDVYLVKHNYLDSLSCKELIPHFCVYLLLGLSFLTLILLSATRNFV